MATGSRAVGDLQKAPNDAAVKASVPWTTATRRLSSAWVRGRHAGWPRNPADVRELVLGMSFVDAPASGRHVAQIGADLRAQAAGLAFELLC
jgi:hypothetical protein